MDHDASALSVPQAGAAVAPPHGLVEDTLAELPPESLWRLLQQAPHMAPRTARPRSRELDE